MSFDLTIVCIDYRDRTLITAVVIYTVVSCFTGAWSAGFVANLLAQVALQVLEEAESGRGEGHRCSSTPSAVL